MHAISTGGGTKMGGERGAWRVSGIVWRDDRLEGSDELGQGAGDDLPEAVKVVVRVAAGDAVWEK